MTKRDVKSLADLAGSSRLEDRGPLVGPGLANLVDAQRYPALHATVERRLESAREERGQWQRIAELRREGQVEAAERLARKLLGIQGPPMTEEKKEELRAWKEAHKEEIRQRKEQQRSVRERTLALLTTGRRRR
ncbi:MAG: hypothetical protein ACRDZ4_17705 [Egibacteraceae bacterium]